MSSAGQRNFILREYTTLKNVYLIVLLWAYYTLQRLLLTFDWFELALGDVWQVFPRKQFF